jgi:hypothetical protein
LDLLDLLHGNNMTTEIDRQELKDSHSFGGGYVGEALLRL